MHGHYYFIQTQYIVLVCILFEYLNVTFLNNILPHPLFLILHNDNKFSCQFSNKYLAVLLCVLVQSLHGDCLIRLLLVEGVKRRCLISNWLMGADQGGLSFTVWHSKRTVGDILCKLDSILLHVLYIYIRMDMYRGHKGFYLDIIYIEFNIWKCISICKCCINLYLMDM